MKTRRILLTMSEELYKKLLEHQEGQGYLTIQELINQMLRNKLMKP